MSAVDELKNYYSPSIPSKADQQLFLNDYDNDIDDHNNVDDSHDVNDRNDDRYSNLQGKYSSF